MAVIERWECPEHGPTLVSDDGPAKRFCSEHGKSVVPVLVKYVRASTNRGAVDPDAIVETVANAIWPLDKLSDDEARDRLRSDVQRGLEAAGLLTSQGTVSAERMIGALRVEFGEWVAAHHNAALFDWRVAAENVIRNTTAEQSISPGLSEADLEEALENANEAERLGFPATANVQRSLVAEIRRLRQLRGAVCASCAGTGLVRVHGAEDYGVSFESEYCEDCDYGRALIRIEQLEADLHDAKRGAV